MALVCRVMQQTQRSKYWIDMSHIYNKPHINNTTLLHASKTPAKQEPKKFIAGNV